MGPGFLFTPEGLIGQTWARQQPAWVTRLDDLEPEEIRIADQLGVRALLAVPIRSAERVWGLLLIFQVCGSLFPEDDLSLLGLLAEQYALALDNAALVAEQQRLLEQE